MAGAAYLVHGPVSGSYDLDVIAAGVIHASASNEHLGTAVSAGDVDGDGTPDLVIGADDGEAGQGAVYVFNTPPVGSVTTDQATATLVGRGDAGMSVTAEGDADGDGQADILVGGQWAGANSGGAAWLVVGAPVHVRGTDVVLNGVQHAPPELHAIRVQFTSKLYLLIVRSAR